MRGLYAYQLQHWLRFFPSEQLLVLNHEQVWRFGRVEGLVYVGIWPLILYPVSACLSFLRILYHHLHPSSSPAPCTHTIRTHLQHYPEKV